MSPMGLKNNPQQSSFGGAQDDTFFQQAPIVNNTSQ